MDSYLISIGVSIQYNSITQVAIRKYFKLSNRTTLPAGEQCLNEAAAGNPKDYVAQKSTNYCYELMMHCPGIVYSVNRSINILYASFNHTWHHSKIA